MIQFNPSPEIGESSLVFPASSGPTMPKTQPVSIPRFNASEDEDGVKSHVPHMEHFFDNSLQTGLMRDLAIDLEILGEHLVLLGNQVRPGQVGFFQVVHVGNLCRVWERTK